MLDKRNPSGDQETGWGLDLSRQEKSSAKPATSRGVRGPEDADLLSPPAGRARRRVRAQTLGGLVCRLLFFPLGMALWGPLVGLIGRSPALWSAFGLFSVLIGSLLLLPDTSQVTHERAPVLTSP
jgi:hypothetical protein